MTENSMIKLNVYSEMINKELKKFAAEKPALRENICEAMDYSLTAGGKRLRPILMLEFCRMCGGNASGLMKTACSMCRVWLSPPLRSFTAGPRRYNHSRRRGRRGR